MDPMMPTSFIPKRPVSSEPISGAPKNHSFGVMSLIATIAVVATAVSFGGVYFYQRQLVTQKTKTEEYIDKAKSNIGSDFLIDMKRLDARIEGVKTLVGRHIVVSPIFQALEATTLRSIQYKSFQYAFEEDPVSKGKVVVVTVLGVAKSYTTIALQSDAFVNNSLIKNPVFSALTVDDKTGAINFNLKFTVSVEDLSFEKFTKSLSTETL